MHQFQLKDGTKLQKILQEYDAEKAKQNPPQSYIEEFWSDAYLAPDCSVVLNLNPFFLLEDDPDAKKAKDQIKRAASLSFHSLKFAASLKNEVMQPDEFKGTTLCMDQFRSIFGSCRVPKDGSRDVVEVDLDSDHVAVLYRNQFYYFRALWSAEELEDGSVSPVSVAVNETDIEEILESIVKDGQSTDLAESVQSALGVLTTLPRNQWAQARYQLINSSPDNSSALDVIDSALFVLVLDDYLPENIHDAAANMLHGTHIMKEMNTISDNTTSGGGDSPNSTAHGSNHRHESRTLPKFVREYQAGTCCNRWYDKLQIIVCSDASAGINFEHSAIDGHTALRFASDIFAESVVTFAKSITKSIYTQGCPIPNVIHGNVLRAATGSHPSGKSLDTNAKKLEFQIVEKLKDSIFYAESALGDAVVADDTHILEYDSFGKNFIVGNKMSPDSLVQMSIILGYYRLYGKFVNTYEPVLTKKYFHGRTEAMRSATMKAGELCKVWMNRFSTKDEKLNALRESTKYHSMLVRECSEGKGVDRHLYGLKCIAEKKGMPVPEFFRSEAYTALNHTVLSTSNCGNPALRLFGFGPVVPDGFGIGYIIKDSRLQYSISSKHRQTKRFAYAIRQTLDEIQEFLEPLKSQSLGYHNASSHPMVRSNGASLNHSSGLEFAEGYSDFYGDSSVTPFGGNGSLPTPKRSSSKDSSTPSFVGLAKVAGNRLSIRSLRDGDSVGTQISEKKK